MPHPLVMARAAMVEHGAIQKEGELAQLVSLVMDLEPKVIVEVGSFDGGTLWIWQQLAPTVIGVDRPPEGYRLETRVNSLGCPVVCGDSHQPATLERLEELLEGRQVDFLFIDGDHTFDGVTADFQMYGPLVRAGGVIGFHDVCGHPAQSYIEVDRFWAALDGDKETFISEPHWWGGIGVLRVPADPVAAAEARQARMVEYHRAQEQQYSKK